MKATMTKSGLKGEVKDESNLCECYTYGDHSVDRYLDDDDEWCYEIIDGEGDQVDDGYYDLDEALDAMIELVDQAHIEDTQATLNERLDDLRSLFDDLAGEVDGEIGGIEDQAGIDATLARLEAIEAAIKALRG